MSGVAADCASRPSPRFLAFNEVCEQDNDGASFQAAPSSDRPWQRGQETSPHLQVQTVDRLEMVVTCHQDEPALPCDGGDPDVVFRKWAALLAELVLDPTVLACVNWGTPGSVQRRCTAC